MLAGLARQAARVSAYPILLARGTSGPWLVLDGMTREADDEPIAGEPSTVEPLQPTIDSETHARYLAEIDRLMQANSESPDHDYGPLIDCLAQQVAQYEDKAFPMRRPAPHEVLEHLMEARNMPQHQLAEHTGIAASQLSDILRGEQEITPDAASTFAGIFHVSPHLFIARRRPFRSMKEAIAAMPTLDSDDFAIKRDMPRKVDFGVDEHEALEPRPRRFKDLKEAMLAMPIGGDDADFEFARGTLREIPDFGLELDDDASSSSEAPTSESKVDGIDQLD